MTDSGRTPNGAAVRFLVLGLSSTAATAALFVLLMYVMPYAVAYAASFVTGILINALLVPSFVFRAGRDRRTGLGIACWSLVVLALGASLSAVGEARGWSPVQTAVTVALIVVPVNFLGSRLVVARLQRPAQSQLDTSRSLP
jgi:putative flippase GtrA